MDWSSHIRRILVHLGEDATFTHGTTASSVRGMYTEPYAALPGGMEVPFAMTEPRFAAMTADLSSVEQGDTITRGTTQFRIVDVQPDDPSGLTIVQLQKV